MQVLLMIMIEGLSKSYLSKYYAPYLNYLINSGSLGTVKPLFAFRGIEATIFTGLYPRKHNIWSEFNIKDEYLQNQIINSIDQKINNLAFSLIDQFPSDKLKKLARYGFQKIIENKNIQMGNLIPKDLLNAFEPSLKSVIHSEFVLGSIPTLFDVLRKNQLNFVYIEPNRIGSYNVLELIRKSLKDKSNCSFFYIKISELDSVGHKYGPNSREIEEELYKVDILVKKIVETFREFLDDFSIIITSAHGMGDVKNTIDLQMYLNRHVTNNHKNYVVFLDSTVARFWFQNIKTEMAVKKILNKLKFGHILLDYEKKELNLPSKRNVGELFFALNEGYVIHPSYFHSSRVPRGMHGYSSETSSDSFTPLIVNIPNMLNANRPKDYTEIFPLMLKLLGL